LFFSVYQYPFDVPDLILGAEVIGDEILGDGTPGRGSLNFLMEHGGFPPGEIGTGRVVEYER